MGGIECGKSRDSLELIETADVIHPACAAFRIGGDAENDDEDVERRSNDCGNCEHAEYVAVLEFVLRRRICNTLKPDERPGRDEGNSHHLADRALVREEGRGHRHARTAVADHARREADRDADREKDHQNLYEAGGGQLALYAQESDQGDDENRHQRFAEVDFIAEDRVEISDFEDALQKVARKQRDACGVRPEDGDIHEEHEPRDKKREVIAEDAFYIVVQSARPGVAVRQIMIMARYHQHHD